MNTYYRSICQEASTLSLQKNCTVRINKKNYFNNIIEFNNKIDNKNKSTKNNLSYMVEGKLCKTKFY